MTGQTSLPVALIGCGRRGGDLVGAIAEHQHSHLVRCIDVDIDAAQGLADRYGGIEVNDELDAAFLRSDVEAVLIATHPDSHAELVSAAARAGKHVFVEAPLATKFPDASRAHAAVRAAGVVGSVDYGLRAAAGVQLTRLTVPRPRALVLHATVDPLGEAWEGEAQHGGVLGTFGTHALDLALYLAASGPVRVYGAGGRYVRRAGLPDTLAATIKFAGGAVAQIVVGEFGASDSRGTYWGELSDASRRATLWHDLTEARVVDGDRVVAETAAISDGRLGHAEALDAFIRAVRGGGRPLADTADGARAVQLADGLYEAMGIGRPVELETIS